MSRGMKMMVAGVTLMIIGAGIMLLAKTASEVSLTPSHLLEDSR